MGIGAKRVALLGVVLAAVWGIGSASVGADDGRHAVHFTLSNSITAATAGQAQPGDFSRCRFQADGSFEPCVVPVTPKPGFDGTITGDLRGVQRTADEAVLGVLVGAMATSVDFPVIDFERFEVTVPGCGNGSFVLRRDGNVGSPDSTWEIVANSGRGDLVGISGHGTATGAFTGPGSTFVDTFVGRVSCGDRHR